MCSVGSTGVDGSYFGGEYAGGDGTTEEDQSPWSSGLSSPQEGDPPYAAGAAGGSLAARTTAARLRMATLDNIVVLMRYRRSNKDVLLRYENDRTVRP